MVVQALPPPVPAFEISVASQGMSKGLLQSDGPQFTPRAIVKWRDFQAGGQWKNISTNSAKGEASLFFGWSGKAGSTDLAASIAYKMLTSASGSGNRQSVEFSGNAARKFGKVGVKAGAVFSLDDLGATGHSLYVEGGPSIELPLAIKASAAIGHRWRERAADYSSFNVGLSRPVAKIFIVDTRLYFTDRRELGENYERRLIASIKLSL